jgi:hypothetical protein
MEKASERPRTKDDEDEKDWDRTLNRCERSLDDPPSRPSTSAFIREEQPAWPRHQRSGHQCQLRNLA